MKIKLYTLLIQSKKSTDRLLLITKAFSSHAINIDSLSTSKIDPEVGEVITLTAWANKTFIEKIAVEISVMEGIQKVSIVADNDICYRKLALFKLDMDVLMKNFFLQESLINQECRIVEINSRFVILTKVGDQNQLQKLYDKLKPIGILQWEQSGIVPILLKDGIGIVVEKNK